MDGQLSREGDLKTLPFNMTISSLRRKKLLELIMNSEKDATSLQDNVKSFSHLILKRNEKSRSVQVPKSDQSKRGLRKEDLDEELISYVVPRLSNR